MQSAHSRYIIIFKEQPPGIANSKAAQTAVEKTNNIFSSLNISQDSLIHQYKWTSHGFAGKFSKEQADKLSNHPLIHNVVKDYYYKAIQVGVVKRSRSLSESRVSSQTIPWGVNRVGGPLDGTGKTVWIMDTGIDLDHSDLNVDENQSTSLVSGYSPNDGLGHGTHVAGIVAAQNNNQNIVGVAAGATAVAVRVCDDQGGCWVSDVKAGVDYVANNHSSGDVANISLGWPTNVSDHPRIDIPLSDLETSITNAADAGLRFTISAGNNRDDADNYSPARVNHSNVWTVSAYREGDEFAETFDWNTPNCNPNQDQGSNYSNPPVDYAAPGENILSLWNDGGTYTTCGTSMAAPHIAGLLLTNSQGLDTDGTVSNDPDGDLDEIAVADLPMSVTVSGPLALRTGQQGTYSANVSHEEGSITYEWYYRTSPSGSWISTGANSSGYTHTFYNQSGQDEDHAIRVDVSSAGENASDHQNVRILPECDDGPGGKSTITPTDIEPCD